MLVWVNISNTGPRKLNPETGYDLEVIITLASYSSIQVKKKNTSNCGGDFLTRRVQVDGRSSISVLRQYGLILLDRWTAALVCR